jgi:hypothetical protein
LKFAQGGGNIEKPKKKKPLSENDSEGSLLQELGETETETETETTPNNESETGEKSGVNAKLKLKVKTETFEHQNLQPDLEKSVSKMATILQLETQFFPYEKHVRNARQSFKRAFEESRKQSTIVNRMATAQQHINALLFEGFNVWVDEGESSLLHFDKLNNPTLKANNWEAVVELNGGIPSLERFQFEEDKAVG